MRETPLVLSLFPGIGLLDMAFEEAGFCVVRGPDLLWGGDIRRFHVPAGRFDGVIGGPPCKAFSRLVHIVRAVHGEDSVSANLIPEYERVVTEAAPSWFVMENVPGAPLPNVSGYVVRDTMLNNRWLGEVQNRSLGRSYDHPDLIDATRDAVRAIDVPYVIEQPMMGARLRAPVVYCGTSFGLPVYRHRQFESSLLLLAPACEHDRLTEAKYWTSYRRKAREAGTDPKAVRSRVVQVYGNSGETHLWGPALGIDWMTPDELTQAIPPAYTEHIGRQLLAAITAERAA